MHSAAGYEGRVAPHRDQARLVEGGAVAQRLHDVVVDGPCADVPQLHRAARLEEGC